MRNTIRYLDPSFPLIDGNGVALNHLRLFLLQTQLRGLLIGEGSPEGIVEAQQGMEYMDETGAPGAVKYIKQLADIGGDRTQGWVAIG